jgi:hypothetical protein
VKDLVKFYKAINDWNTKAGVKDCVYDTQEWWQAVALQAKLLVEEASETVEASDYGDPVELIDGVVDTFVVMSKFMDILDKAGFDVSGAMQAIIDNNEKKVFDSYYQAVEEKEKLEERDDTEYTIETSILNGLPFYSVKRFDGKVAKPVNHPKVDLSEFIP